RVMRRKEARGLVLSAGPGKNLASALPRDVGPFISRPGRGTRTMPLGCSWPKHRNSYATGRSSGFRLLTASNDLPAFGLGKPNAVVHSGSRASPITAAAPQRICTVFPFTSRLRAGAGGPVDTMEDL